jgi:glycerol-3-phosphate dehydrogenase
MGLSQPQVEHLLNRYGSLVAEIRELVAERLDLVQPLASAPGYLKVEAVYAAAHEGALHLDDILTRRTRISIETWDRGVAAATEVARLVAPVLGWDEADIAREIEHYEKRVAAERQSQDQPDDLTADAARLGAPDVRMGRTGPASISIGEE